MMGDIIYFLQQLDAMGEDLHLKYKAILSTTFTNVLGGIDNSSLRLQVIRPVQNPNEQRLKVSYIITYKELDQLTKETIKYKFDQVQQWFESQLEKGIKELSNEQR